MNYGRFFEFDFESSKLDDGVAVFNYRWLQDNNNGDNDRQSPRYPIYLTFTSEAIVFNLHYRDNNVHYHNAIIELYLSPNLEITDGLTESLNEAYFSEFPVKEPIGTDGKKYLQNLIYNAYKKNNAGEGYSGLDIISIDTIEKYEKGSECVRHFLRKIVLDFLYDFEFTSVFKNLSFYNVVSIRLKENFLFSALTNKIRYYYYRMNLIGGEVLDIISEDRGYSIGGKTDVGLQFMFQQYEKVEHEWVESILHPKAMKAFHESPWFNECHEELEQVYLVNREKNLSKHREKKRRQVSFVPSSNVSQVVPIPNVYAVPVRNSDKRGRFLLMSKISKGDTFGFTVSNLLSLIHKKQSKESKKNEQDSSSSFARAINSHNDTAIRAVKWEIEHYRLWGVMRVWCGDKVTRILSLCALLLAFALMAGVNFVINHLNNEGITHINSGFKFIMVVAVGVGLLLAFRKVVRKKRRNTWGAALPSMLMPRLLAAVVAAWFTMCMSEELFLKLSLPDFNWSAATIIVIITIIFIVYESYSVNPYVSKRHHIVSSVCIFLLAYMYAFVTGTLVYDYFGQHFLSEYVDELYLQGIEYKLQKPPDGSFFLWDLGKKLVRGAGDILEYRYIFIAQFSFFATFIGIFLQLMLQGVSITKSE